MGYYSYKNLEVWKLAVQVAKDIYILVTKLPKEERFGLSDQMRRAAVSVVSNIAEGHGRNSIKEFIHFLSIARGSTSELETQVILCIELNLVNNEDVYHLFDSIDKVGRMITSLISSLEKRKTKNEKPNCER